MAFSLRDLWPFGKKPAEQANTEIIPAQTAEVSPVGTRRGEVVEEIVEILDEAEPQLEIQIRFETSEYSKNPESIVSCDKYTVINEEQFGNITVVNESGETAELFRQYNSLEFSWKNIGDALGFDEILLPIAQPTSQHRKAIKIDALPAHLRSRAMQEMNNSNQLQTYDARDKSHSCSEDGHVWENYIVFVNKENKFFIAFQFAKGDTKTLLPHNWIRFDSSNANVPTGLSEHVAEIFTKNEQNKNVKDVGEKYLCTTSDKGLQIFPKDQRNVAPEYEDNIPYIRDNYCTDPTNPAILYYCTQTEPKTMQRLDTNKARPWHADQIPFPEKPYGITALRMHPSGEFFLCNINSDQQQILRSDTLERVACPEIEKMTQVRIGEDDTLCCVDSEGHVISLQTNLGELAQFQKDKRKASALQGFSAAAIIEKATATTKTKKTTASTVDVRIFKADKTRCDQDFALKIAGAQTTEDLDLLRIALDLVRKDLRENRKMDQAGIDCITGDVANAIGTKNQQLADQMVTTLLAEARARLGGAASLDLFTNVRQTLKIDESVRQALSPAIRLQVENICGEIDGQIRTLLEEQGEVFIQQIGEMLLAQEEKLKTMEKQSDFDHWLDNELPAKQRWLGDLVAFNPPQKALDSILHTRSKLAAMRDTYDEKFRTQRDTIREGASRFTEGTANYLKDEIKQFIERLERKGFRTFGDAKAFIEGNVARQALKAQIRSFAKRDESASAYLLETLENSIEQFLFAVERRGQMSEGTDGKGMVRYGNTTFPRFEGHVRERGARRTQLTFVGDDNTRGEGTLSGDVAMRITTAGGRTMTMNLWEKILQDHSANPAEGDMRDGLHSHRGQKIAPSYRTREEYLALQKLYGQWRNEGPLYKQYEVLHLALKEHYGQREKPNVGEVRKPRSGDDAQWQEKYRELLRACADFSATNQVPLLRRIENIENAADPEFENGKGLVPERRNHWVMAPEDEILLEKMAKCLKKQLDPDYQQGALLLKGHAGTGKDVALRIFAHETNRPFFSFNCSKQTTEYDLSQDIALAEGKGGSTVTVKEDSLVLRALETPGAILNFNEFNNMTEPVQIFLNDLLAEPRAMTLKTSSGRIVKAHPSVLITASMNAGYKGTNPLAKSTRDRLDEIEVKYAPLRREPEADDTLPGKPFSASEPLKIARRVKSLKADSMCPNMKRNDFVKMWDAHINKIGESPKALTPEQTFDMDVILALVQLADHLRDAFIKGFNDGPKPANLLPVSHPVTLRVLSSCAFDLDNMSDDDKGVGKKANKIARDLLKKNLLQHIDSAAEQAKITTAIDNWPIVSRDVVSHNP